MAGKSSAGEAKSIIIIKKKRGDAHAGGHGGAWKVAYADFVTAMMALFMVMWLMANDEEVRISVANYFNAHEPFNFSDALNKNGRRNAGDNSLRHDGDQGRYEEEVLQKPSSTAPVYLEEQNTLQDLANSPYDGSAFSRDTEAEKVKLKVPGQVIFKAGSSELDVSNFKYLDRLSVVFKEYAGIVEIQGYADSTDTATDQTDLYSLAFKRAQIVRQYLLQEGGVNSTKLIPVAAYRPGVDNTKNQKDGFNRKVHFMLKHTRTD